MVPEAIDCCLLPLPDARGRKLGSASQQLIIFSVSNRKRHRLLPASAIMWALTLYRRPQLPASGFEERTWAGRLAMSYRDCPAMQTLPSSLSLSLSWIKGSPHGSKWGNRLGGEKLAHRRQGCGPGLLAASFLPVTGCNGLGCLRTDPTDCKRALPFCTGSMRLIRPLLDRVAPSAVLRDNRRGRDIKRDPRRRGEESPPSETTRIPLLESRLDV